MKLYNFTRLITKYKATFQIVSENSGGYDDGGEWKAKDKEIQTKEGAIVPMSERKIYHSGGTYTTQDRQLYMFEKLPDALIKNCRIIYHGNQYKIEEETDYSEYSDVYVYILRRVSAVD